MAPTLFLSYVLGIAATGALARHLKTAAGNGPAPVLYPGWPAFWTTTSTLLLMQLVRCDCQATHSLYLMAWTFFFPPVLTSLVMQCVLALSQRTALLGRSPGLSR